MGTEADVADLVRTARKALDEHDWATALERFREADAAGGLNADGLADLGSAAWWVGDIETSVDARARAFNAFLADGRPELAAEAALHLARMHNSRGEGAIAGGWLAQGRRVLGGRPDSVAHVWLEAFAAYAAQQAGRIEEALAHAERAVEIAEGLGDRTGLAVALNRRGAFLAWSGRVEEGLRDLDEAMVAAVAGDLDPFTTGVIYCNTISACAEMADYRRAGEWTAAATRWCERQSIGGFPGICRVFRAEIMQLRGDWAGAEEEARRAVDELGGHQLHWIAAAGLYEIGEIRLRMGDVAGAEAAFRDAHAAGHDAQPGRALVQLHRGRIEQAAASIATAVAESSADRLRRARLLPVQVEIAVAAGDAETARLAAEDLRAIAEDYGSQALRAGAELSAARAALAAGDIAAALGAAQEAWRGWNDVEAPYEAARARELLGELHERTGDLDSARLALESARATYERLGAIPAAARVADRLGSLVAGDAAASPAGLRESRTFVFTDIVSSTNLVELLGDEAWTELLTWHDATLRGCVDARGGEVVDTAGDGFFVAFPDAASALGCAVDVQRTLAAHRREHGFAPQLRIGVHAAEATRRAGSYRGRGVHAAARIGALAEGGEILVSTETLEAAGAGIVAGEPRSVSLKGLSEPIDVVSVDWRSGMTG